MRGLARVQSDIHTATADIVVNLLFARSRFRRYVLGGGGSLVFRPTGNAGALCPALTRKRKELLCMAAVLITHYPNASLYALSTAAMFTRMPILASAPLTPTDGRTRRNHPLELFSDSDRKAPGGPEVPACPVL
jgi:hypothetical protein